MGKVPDREGPLNPPEGDLKEEVKHFLK